MVPNTDPTPVLEGMWLPSQADSNGIPDMLKCDFLDPIICAMAESVFTLVQHDVDTHLVDAWL